MLLECACGKKYRLRDGAANAPQKCPACGGALRPSASPAAPPPAAAEPRPDPEGSALRAILEVKDRRLAETQAKNSQLEGELEEARRDLANLEGELQEARTREDSAGDSVDRAAHEAKVRELEERLAAAEQAAAEARAKGPGAMATLLREKDQEIEEAQASIARLGEGLAKEKAAYHDALEKKDQELADLRTRGQGFVVAALKDKEREIEEAQASIARLGEDLAKEKAAYHDALKRKDEELADLHARARDLDGSGAPPAPAAAGPEDLEAPLPLAAKFPGQNSEDLERAKGRISQLENMVKDAERRYIEQQKDLGEARAAAPKPGSVDDLERALQRVASLEKIVQDAGQHQAMLREELDSSHAREGNPQALGEKDKVISSLQDELAARKSELDALQRRLSNLEAIRKAEQGSFQSRVETQQSVGARVGEARYLAGDLQRSLESLALSLGGLVGRVQRLHQALNTEGEERNTMILPAPGAVAPAPRVRPPEPEPEPAPAPAEEPAAGLESLPEPSPSDDLPADETLLDMGNLGKKVRQYQAPEPVPQEPASEDGVRLVDSPDEGGQTGLGEGPLSAETSPGPLPGEEPSEPGAPGSRKGLFGKFFGNKKPQQRGHPF